MDTNFDLEKFVEKCPKNLSGADFYAIGNRARKNTLKRLILKMEEASDESEKINNEDILITEEDFKESLNGFNPTLSEKEVQEYEKYFTRYQNKE